MEDTIDLDLTLDMDLDMSWAEEFLEEDAKYADFYEGNVTFIQLRILYVDKNNEIVKAKRETIQLMNANCLSREELLYIIKKNKTQEGKCYETLSIAKFNIDLRGTDIKTFLKSKKTRLGDIYLSPLKEVDSVTYNKTIGALQKLNEILIIFYDANH